jgi:hypothetical protein
MFNKIEEKKVQPNINYLQAFGSIRKEGKDDK